MSDERLRVMFVATSLEVGGAERLLVEIINHLDLTSFQPMVACLKGAGALADRLAEIPVPVFSNLMATKFDLRVLHRLTRLMRRRRVDAVFTLNPGDKMFWGRLCARLARVPITLSAIHSTGAVRADGSMTSVIGWFNKRLTPFTDAFIALCEFQRDFLVEAEGLPADKVEVVYNGIALETIRPTRPADQVRAELDLPLDAPVIGLVAVMRPEKRHDVFLRAAALVLKRHPEARFLVVGDGPLRPRVESLWRALGLQDRVLLLGFRTDVIEVMNVMDVVALTSHPADTFPLVLLEAMALGKPLVVTDVPGGIKEMVSAGTETAGLIVAPQDPRTVARAVTQLIDNPDLAERLGRAGRARVAADFTIDQTVTRLENLILDLARQKGRRRT